jgi:hypothetical protein
MMGKNEASVRQHPEQTRGERESRISNIDSASHPSTSADAENLDRRKPDTEIFLGFHYNELKDLGKHFLTIVSAVLAFSVTFSERMVDFTKATPSQKALLISSWSFLIVAVVTAGTGIYLNFIAGARASGSIIKERKSDFKPLVRCTYRLYEIAGGCFVLSLILMATIAALKFL